MAGIGFELKRLITHEGGLLSRIRGYAIASLVSSGPWIVTILGLLFAAGLALFYLAKRGGFELAGPAIPMILIALVVLGLLGVVVARNRS